MKRKLCIAVLALSGGIIMVFAASPEADKCVQKFEACKVTCSNQKEQCKARGNDIAYCNARLNECNADCNKEVKKCQEKAGVKPTAPQPKPPTKPKK